MSSAQYTVNGVRVALADELRSAHYDGVVTVTAAGAPGPQALEDFIAAAHELDHGLEGNCAVLNCPRVSGGRLILSSMGKLTPYDDVRSVYEASRAGVQRALAAGCTRPLLALHPLQPPQQPQQTQQPHQHWPRAALVALLGALEALYVPLQIRESFPSQAHRATALGVYGEGLREALPELLREAAALEIARGVARDIGGADPERMTPRAVAAYLRRAFRHPADPADSADPADTTDPADSAFTGAGRVSVRVVEDPAVLARDYPLFAAVSRAADCVDRHRGCVVFLEYVPEKYDRTVMLVGKGVTYDTGGCDVKAGGAMAGMSRDKCGAAAVAGFLKACSLLAGGVKAVAALALVRNSVGSEAYVADELLRARCGLAVRVGNTDAEGRMIMADLLSEMHDRAAAERNPHLYTVATLTGHAVRAVGPGYSIVMDNHQARATDHAAQFRKAGESVSDMVEVSTIRREDLAFHRGQAAGDQVHQANNQPSTATPRGHQGPAGFLLLTSGLQAGSTPYSHLDVAASAGSLPEPPTAAPLLALAAHYGLIRSC